MDTGLAKKEELHDTYIFSSIVSIEDLDKPRWSMTIH